MALLDFAPEQVRPTALALNLLVGGIGTLVCAGHETDSDQRERQHPQQGPHGDLQSSRPGDPADRSPGLISVPVRADRCMAGSPPFGTLEPARPWRRGLEQAIDTTHPVQASPP
jgi:hypothetical protein